MAPTSKGERREVARRGQRHKGTGLILMPSCMVELIKLAVRMLVISGNRIGGVFVFVSLVDRQLHFGVPGRDEGRVSPHGKGGAMRGQLFVLLDIWSTVTVRGIATECACGGRYEEVAATNGSDGDRC